ncbi:hypothetical protein E1B28_000405 [Marasmius oreades]|uniref:Uncharacterized protein n=1 Tax=Marasmius oreades TaxID=181124 RepID=A0A9P7V178_9AGAR|nr:uncharacterized protein E1B28_000405 [Marasmius oreades]KAG7098455.1 hypothetical protein E1B28_000405 [Marasmius oreades]
MNHYEDYESRCSSLGPLISRGMGLHNCGYFARVINRRGCRNSGMRLTLSEGDVVFITNNHIAEKPGWLFGIRLTGDNSLAEVGLVHQSDIAQVSKDEISRWPAILDRPIPSSVSSVLFLGGRTGRVHFGIPARIVSCRTGYTTVRVQGEMGRYLDVDVGEVVLLVGYANNNYYAIKASWDDHDRVWSGLVDHHDVILLRPVGPNELVDIQQEPLPIENEDADDRVEHTNIMSAGTGVGDLQGFIGMEGYLDNFCQKASEGLSPFNLRIMKWRSEVYANSYSRIRRFNSFELTTHVNLEVH